MNVTFDLSSEITIPISQTIDFNNFNDLFDNNLTRRIVIGIGEQHCDVGDEALLAYIKRHKLCFVIKLPQTLNIDMW